MLTNILRRLNLIKLKNQSLVPIPYAPSIDIWDAYWQMTHALKPSSVLEAGTRRTEGGGETHHMAKFPWVSPASYIRLDVQSGLDVDYVGDLHNLPAHWDNKFQSFVATSVFEHLERPWLAAKEIARVLQKDATFIVVTHQCFPLHAHPHDFFRFSKEALRLIFEDAGLEVTASEYSDRCLIVPPTTMIPDQHLDYWNTQFPSFAMVAVVGKKK